MRRSDIPVLIGKRVIIQYLEYKGTTFEEIRPILAPSEFYEIISCIFSSISITVDGGAINFEKNVANSLILRCNFFNCLSTAKGGAIYFSGDILVVKMSCFDMCVSMEGGQSLFANLTNGDSSLNITHTYIYKCSYDTLIGLCRTSFAYNGEQYFSLANYTNNVVESEGSALVSTHPQKFTFSYVNIVNNTGQCAFWFHSHGPLDLFIQCNIVENKISGKESVIMLECCNIIIQYFRFLRYFKSPLVGGGDKITLVHSFFESEQRRDLFPIRSYNIVDSFFDERDLKPLRINIIPSDNCWASGEIKHENLVQGPNIKIIRPKVSYKFPIHIVFGVIIIVLMVTLNSLIIYYGLKTNYKIPNVFL